VSDLDELESQSVFIPREAFRKVEKLALPWSIDKDSKVMCGWRAKRSSAACRSRWYAKARREIASFTGVSDLYEPPQAPELEIATDVLTPAESLAHLLAYVEQAFRLDDVRRLAS
jgi:hypothetical protein